VGYFSVDEKGAILEANLTGATLLGTERSRLIGSRFQLFVPTQSRTLFQAFLEKVFSGEGNQTCEVPVLQANRVPFWSALEARAAIAIEGANRWCRMTLVDIGARKRSEESLRQIESLAGKNREMEQEIRRRQAVETALKESEEQSRRLSHQILLAQERQRKEISRALHDEISQLLLGIGVHLEIFASKAVMAPKSIRRDVAPMRRLVAKSLKIVHQFARDLRPEMLDDLGLIPALQSHLGDFAKRTGLKIKFTAFSGDESLNNDKRTVLYRIAQEALVNVAKHAKATAVKVILLKTDIGVRLEVADNGEAFDISRLTSPEWGNHLGLMGMRERVEMVGGRFGVDSKPGTGTIIRAEVPFGIDKLSDLKRSAKRSRRGSREFGH
jgi:PAS domain S-box-containing protein